MPIQFVNRPESSGEKLAKGIGAGLDKGVELYGQHKQGQRENEAIKRLTGNDVSGLSPDLKKEFVKNFMKKKEEDTSKFSMGLNTLDAMEALKNKGNIGRGTGITRLFGGDAARDAAEYEQLGKSLIPIVAAGVPVRNQKEFEEYKKVLVDASSSDAEKEGAINGLRHILKSKLGMKGYEEESDEMEPSSSKVKPGTKLTSDKAKAILKKTGGDKAKARQVAKKMGYTLG